MEPHLSKMAPTPPLFALSRCSSEASCTPSFRAMERWEKEAIRSSFQPEEQERDTCDLQLDIQQSHFVSGLNIRLCCCHGCLIDDCAVKDRNRTVVKEMICRD